MIGRPVSGITGSIGIVVEVVVDEAVVVDAGAVLVVVAGSVVGTVDSAAVVAGDAPLLPHAATVSAAIINVIVVVYFTALPAVRCARGAGGYRTAVRVQEQL